MGEEARAAFIKLEQIKPEASTLSAIRDEIDAAMAQAPTAEEPAVEEISVEPAEAPVEPEAEAPAPEPKPGALDKLVNDLESSLGDGFLPETSSREVAPEPAPETAEYAQASTQPQPAGKLNEFVSDLEASLGDSFLPEAPVVQAETQVKPQPEQQRPARPQPVPVESEAAAPVVAQSAPASAAPAAMAASAAQSVPPPTAATAAPTFTYQPARMRPLAAATPVAAPLKFDSGAGVDLADMFGELKHELEEDSAVADEDPETHYNLGVAFREMGLLDEAIGELQKVCQSVDRGHPFPHIMQTYTWLAQCFLDKGVPEAAIRWYEKRSRCPAGRGYSHRPALRTRFILRNCGKQDRRPEPFHGSVRQQH